MTEQLPLFEVAIEPLSETEDVPDAPNHFISWDELQERWGYTPEQFAQADTTTMSPVDVDSYFDDTHHIADYFDSVRDNMRLDKE